MSLAFNVFEDADSDLAPNTGFYGTQAGATILKERIEEYWLERGYIVGVSIQKRGFHPSVRAARWEVVSDTVNGLPKNFRKPS